MAKTTSVTVRDLITAQLEGEFDVLQFQRAFNRKPQWVWDLADSLIRGIPISTLLVWIPDEEQRPIVGRYGPSGGATRWIVDGQQRSAAACAALGLRPGWINDKQWELCGGDQLGLSIGVTRKGEAELAPLKGHGRPSVSMRSVYEATQRKMGKKITALLRDADVRADEDAVVSVHQLMEEFLNAEVGLEWLEGDQEKAFLAFRRHNSRSTQLALKPEELKLSILAYRFDPLLRDYIDPIRADSVRLGLSKRAFPLKRLQSAIYRLLPPAYQGDGSIRAPRECVEVAAVRLTACYEAARDYLHDHGLVHDQFISSQGLNDILMHLFDKVPSARSDDFAFRWMAHMIASGVFFKEPGAYSRTLFGVLRSGGYEQIRAVMASALPSGPPSPITPERLYPLTDHKEKTSMGPNGALYALMSAHRPGGVPDLAHGDALVFPDRGFELRRLCENADRGLLPHHALLSDAAADTISALGGWTFDAYQALKPSDRQLAAHQLPIPPQDLTVDEVGDWLKAERTPLLARDIDHFLHEQVGALRAED